MRLFAERGFKATSVGDIEAAVGLQPRRGALYKHFASKQALLEAAVREDLERAGTGATQLDDLQLAVDDPDALRAVVLALGHWFLAEMDRLRDLTLVVEHDGQRMVDLTTAVKADMVDLSYRSAAAVITAAAPGVRDPEATAVVLLGALVAVRRTAWTFGSPPLDLDDDRVLATWADLVVGVLASA